MLDIIMLISNLVFLFIGYHFGTKAVYKEDIDESEDWVNKVLAYRKEKQEEMEAFVAEE